MLNTYGIRSINTKTFNTRFNEALFFPRPLRNIAVTALRINNFALNILGYIPGVSIISGCIRMVIGLAIVSITTAIGDRNAESGAIIGRWYDEAILTGIAQIARGTLEATVPFGCIVNGILDVIATPFNITKEIYHPIECQESIDRGYFTHNRPHPEVSYPFPLFLLHLA
ncbi:MAG: hypothetical protein COT84_04885 [Chlamydiae bacterium CG10_big_fil_rev_8_21_14_0_10_35_9]|nr:MAG: hypothetical protein COT84_04885 [Chlamydiae bacterium CG10_big_fil_rev_8_21_14_0_10_35_9]